jgi:hypothetical protein
MKRLLPFLLLLVSITTLAESGAYRVEVIVFRNLNVATEATGTEALRSFSHLPDFEEPVPAMGFPGDLPEDLHIITQKSPRMNDVWRRLRSSSNYQPLVHVAWQQNRTDYYPPMRIHDQQIIDTQLRPPTHIMIADLAAEDPLAAYRSTFFQLDGSLQLRRSRFLHLFLDLEYRQEELQAGIGSMTDSSVNHGIFTLKQNRQIRTGRMQYFDTPFMGALVFVSAIRE